MNFLQRLAAAPSKILWLTEAATGACRHSSNPKVRLIATALNKTVLPWARRRMQKRMAKQQESIREASQ